MMVERLFLAVPRGCLQFVIVVFSDHTHLLFLVFNLHLIHLGSSDFDRLTPHMHNFKPLLMMSA